MKRKENDQKNIKISTGFNSLDEILSGFKNSGLYTLAGAPSIGKSTFALSIVQQLAKRNIPVGIVSYEMTEMQLLNHLISIESGINYEKISNESELSEEDYNEIQLNLTNLDKLPIYIETSPRLKLDKLASFARDLKKKCNLQFLVIDDIQRIPIDDFSRGYAVNREQEISANVREVKQLARELNIPILLISQLNRLNENRGGDRRPILIDLRDSGAIENDSDVVMFLYRAEFYGFLQDEDGEFTQGTAEILIAKNRHGKTGIAKLSFDKEISSYKEYQKFERKIKEQEIFYNNKMNAFDNSDLDFFDNIDKENPLSTMKLKQKP